MGSKRTCLDNTNAVSGFALNIDIPSLQFFCGTVTHSVTLDQFDGKIDI